MVAAFTVQTATGEVILDLSNAPGATVGDQLIANASVTPATDSGASSATFTLDDTALTSVTMTLNYTGEGEGDQAASNIPLLRTFATAGLGINSALPNGSDNNAGLDEVYGNGSITDESLTFSFSSPVAITWLGLSNFDSENNGTSDIPDVLGITVNSTTTTYLSTDSSVTAGTVNGDSVAILTFDAPLILGPTDVLTIFVASNGDASTRAVLSLQSFGLTDVSNVPEPGALSLIGIGALLMWRKR